MDKNKFGGQGSSKIKDHYQRPILQFYAPKNLEITSAFNKLRCLRTPLMKPFYILKIELLCFLEGCATGAAISFGVLLVSFC